MNKKNTSPSRGFVSSADITCLGPSSLERKNLLLIRSQQISKEEQKADQISRLGILTLQKQRQVLELKQFLVLIGLTTAAVLSRILIHGFSIEPITFLAILAGWLFGSKKGFAVGASSLFISNFFVFGGQGIWTPFQMFGFGLAGGMGGLLRKKATKFECAVVMIVATLSYEIIMNISSIVFIPNTIFGIFLLSLPFTLVHTMSNTLFSTILPKLKMFVEERGEFDMDAVYKEMLKELKCKIKD